MVFKQNTSIMSSSPTQDLTHPRTTPAAWLLAQRRYHRQLSRLLLAPRMPTRKRNGTDAHRPSPLTSGERRSALIGPRNSASSLIRRYGASCAVPGASRAERGLLEMQVRYYNRPDNCHGSKRPCSFWSFKRGEQQNVPMGRDGGASFSTYSSVYYT